MSILNHFAEAAAVLLLIELLVVLLIFLAISGGLAFGLHWVRGKTDWAFGKANGYLPLVSKYVHIGTGYAAKPVIAVSGFAETAKGTVEAIKSMVQSTREHGQESVPVPSVVPIDSAEATLALPVMEVGARPVHREVATEPATTS